jgi:hypothetical protein
MLLHLTGRTMANEGYKDGMQPLKQMGWISSVYSAESRPSQAHSGKLPTPLMISSAGLITQEGPQRESSRFHSSDAGNVLPQQPFHAMPQCHL